MTVDLTLLRTSTQDWARDTSTADVQISGVDAEGNLTSATLSGQAAAAYLFGQALQTVTYQDGDMNGLQLTDGLFEFPSGSGERVTLSELSDALRYKYGVDPVIEFAPGLGLRGYSVTDINNILQLLNREYSGDFLDPFVLLDEAPLVAAANSAYNITDSDGLLGAASTAMLTSATDSELRQYLTEGGDIYINRNGGFYINGVPTNALDLSVTARLLAQDNISLEYKVLMDAYAERNNLTDASWTILDGGLSGLASSTASVESQYGMDDALFELTAGQYDYGDFFYQTDQVANTFSFDDGTDPEWVPGTRIRVALTGSGLTAGTDYYVHAHGNGTYSFHLTQADARNNDNTVDLTGDVAREIYAADADGASVGTLQNVKFPPPGYPDNGEQLINLLDYAAFVDRDFRPDPSDSGDMYLQWDSINPGWNEDTKVEFTSTSGGVEAGREYYVANFYDDNDPTYFFGTQFTENTSGTAGTTDNVLTGKPEGQIVLYDGGNTVGYDEWRGYNQFSLEGTDYATGTAFSLDRNVDLVLKHTLGDDRWYKDVVALKQGETYYLRNEGGGMYSVYASQEQALAGGETGRFYFAMDTYTEGNGNDGGYGDYIDEGTITINGITDAYITIQDLAQDMSFATDPLWGAGPTEVRVRNTAGAFAEDVSYWAVESAPGRYEFYSNSVAANNRDSDALVYGSEPLPDFYRVSDQSLEDTSAIARFESMSAVLNTVISNNVRDGDLDQEKLQTLTAQLQNNTEAMTALIKVFADLRSSLAQALR